MLTDDPFELKLRPGQVCLTFDDGPSEEQTLAIAEFLAKEKIRATFFVVGQRIDRPGGREALARLRQLGHLIGNHTFTHPSLTALISQDEDRVVEEVVRTHHLIREFVGDGPLLFRPPFLHWNPAVCRAINGAQEMRPYVGPIMLDVHGFDWDLGKQRDGVLWNVSHCLGHIVGQLRKLGKGVVLLHDGSAEKVHTPAHSRREQQVHELTQSLVDWLLREKFQFIGLDDVVKAESRQSSK
jgi:peptidoglycan/xylan/chitin deacetylase (PgdA/CDA1 family)